LCILEGHPINSVGPLSPFVHSGFRVIDPGIFLDRYFLRHDRLRHRDNPGITFISEL
jgi:hypothetical protein